MAGHLNRRRIYHPAMSPGRYDRTRPVRHRVGGWLPKDQRVLEAWLDRKIKAIEQRNRKAADWHPVIQEFQHLIESDAEIWMGFHQMFEQVPLKPPYNNDPTGKPQVSFHEYASQCLELMKYA